MVAPGPEAFGIGRLFTQVREAIVVADAASGVIVLWNPAAEAVFGYPAVEIVGRPLEQLIPEHLRTAHQAGLARYQTTGHGPYIDAQTVLELPALHRAGHELTVEMTLSAITDASVPGRFALAVVRDVTERKRAEAARLALAQEQAARAHAEQALQAREQFLSVAAHELKTPVTSLRLATQLALRHVRQGPGGEPARLQSALELIEQQTEKLTRLLGQLLDSSRLSTGKLHLEYEPVDLPAWLHQVAARMELTTPTHPIVVQAGPPLVFPADPLRLEQVLVNLLDNAARHSPSGAPVEVRVEPAEPDQVQIVVADQGPGLTPEHRERVFEPFYQASPGAAAGSLGLGLYISRQIVEAHGGQLWAECPAEGGTRLVCRLPRVPPRDP